MTVSQTISLMSIVFSLAMLGMVVGSWAWGGGAKECPAGSERVWVTVQDGYKCRMYVEPTK